MGGLAMVAWPAKDKKAEKEEQTQVLQLPKELPSVVVGETRRLSFYVTPLSAKGLLSQQVRDALKALERQAGTDAVLEIRAFVAGSGDLRRVRDQRLVAELEVITAGNLGGDRVRRPARAVVFALDPLLDPLGVRRLQP